MTNYEKHMKTLGRLVEKAERSYKRAFAASTRYPRNGNVPSAVETEKLRKKTARLLAEWSALVAAERAIEIINDGKEVAR